MTNQFFDKAMAMMAAFYGNREVLKDEMQMNAWRTFLMFYSDDQVSAAMMHMFDTEPAFPSIQKVTSYIRSMQTQLWEEAFLEAKEKAKGLKYPEYVNGIMRPVTFANPLVKSVLDVIGLDEFLSCPVSQMGTLRAQFRNTYESLVSRSHMQKLAAFSGDRSPVMMMVTGDSAGLKKIALMIEAKNG